MAQRMMSGRWSTVDGMTSDLAALGVRPGDHLLVHSALSSLGFVPRGPAAVIAALQRALGPSGTLVMPTHSWDRVGAGDFSFDIARTPSCVGAISEHFRTMPGVVRSLHPTHSVAASGPGAARLIEGHERADTPCGHGTPYARLIEAQGRVLFLGATLEHNTMFHTFEACARLPYLRRPADEPFAITDRDGTTRTMAFRRHNRGPDRAFGEMRPVFERSGILRSGAVGSSPCLLIDCRAMMDVVMKRLDHDPNCLLATPHAARTAAATPAAV